MRILKLLLTLGSIAGATSIQSGVSLPNPLLSVGDLVVGTTNGAQTNLAAGASGTFLGSNGIGIAPTYQLINYSSLTGTVPTWNQSTTGSAATLTTTRTFSATGDATATAQSFNGSANVVLPMVLATVNASPGTYGDASHAAQVTVNGKGLATTVASVAITPAAIGAAPALSGGSTNSLTKWTGASTIGNSSITDNGSTVTTGEPLVLTKSGSEATSALQIVSVAPYSYMRATGAGTDAGNWEITAAGASGSGQLYFLTVNDAHSIQQTWLEVDRVGTGTTLANFYNNIRAPSIHITGPDTIAISNAKILGTGPSSEIIDNSAATLSNSTTGNAATATKWQTARNLTIGSSTQAQDGTAALTYSLAAIGAQAAGSYLPVNNPTFTGILQGPAGSFNGTGSGTIGAGPYVAIQDQNNVGWAWQLGASNTLDLWDFASSTWTKQGNFSPGGNLNLNGTIQAGTLSGPIISAGTTTYSPAYTGGTMSLSGNISASTISIGALAGTVVASSGYLASLSGTNLVLGNGSTIPQSTFQAAGSYLPVNNPTFTGILQGPAGSFNGTGSGTIGAGPYVLTHDGIGAGWLWQLGASNTWDLWNLTSSTWTKQGNFSPGGNLSLNGTIQAGGTGTAISAPNGDISTGKAAIVGTQVKTASYTILNTDPSVTFGNGLGVAITLPSSDTEGKIRYIVSLASSTAVNFDNTVANRTFSISPGSGMGWVFHSGSGWAQLSP